MINDEKGAVLFHLRVKHTCAACASIPTSPNKVLSKKTIQKENEAEMKKEEEL